MFLLNCTGLKKFHWCPTILAQCTSKYWYLEIKWLGFQACLYNLTMAVEMLECMEEGRIAREKARQA